jgi:CubicO group peptidase (beta-lactamase class C family)
MISQLPSASEMTERLATWIERYRVPGAELAWMHGDDVQTAAAGVTNVETEAPVRTDTLFQIGSITKVYTTTLIMQLADEGRIALEAPASTYLPGLRFGDGGEDAAITIRRLLTHTSGVDGDFFEDFGRGDDCVERYVAGTAKLTQLFPPGSMWSYCNAGFVVLGRIIETLTGMAWDAALRTRLLDRIGADHTVTLPEEAMLRSVSAGHRVTPSLGVELARPWHMTRGAGPAGSTPMSTVGDLLKFAKMHIDGGVARDGQRVLSEASVRQMQREQFDLPPAPGEGARHWGLGWMLFDWGGRRVIGHDGGTIGQMSSLRILPDEGFAVALLTNSLGGGLLAGRVMRWLFAETMGVEMPPRPQPPATPPAMDLAPYTGVYRRLGFELTVSERDGGLMIETQAIESLADSAMLPPSPLTPVDQSLFLMRDFTGQYQPVVFSGFDDAGRPRYLFNMRVARRADA